MRKLILIVINFATLCALSDTETINGYKWSYRIIGGTAEIYDYSLDTAVSPKPTGIVAIPASLGEKTVTSIGNYALKNCTGITSVEIPNSVTEIKSAAFYGCSSLTSVVIPDSVTTVGFNAFACCSRLEAFVVGENNAAYCSANGMLLSKDGTYLVEVPENLATVKIPDNVTCIGVKAFGFTDKLTSVVIPDNVTSIENGAFAQCSGLASVTFKGNAPTTVGQGIFPSPCTVYVSRQASGSFEVDKNGKWHDAKVEYYGPEFTIDANGKLTGVVLHGVTEIEIPNNVTIIGDSAFRSCSGLTSVLIPNGVTGIGTEAFYDCSSLTTLSIPSSVKSIGDNAFEGCGGLTSVHIADLRAWCEIDFVRTSTGAAYARSNPLTYAHNLYINDELAVNLTIPSSVASIKSDAFSGASGLTLVTIPDGVTSIGVSAFMGCSGLTNMVVPTAVSHIGDYAFYGCSGITSITLPNNLTSINSCVFSGCSGLKSVLLPDGVISIAACAFKDCISLTNVEMSIGVKTIGGSAFYNCRSLANFTIPYGVSSVGDSAFRDCSGLKSIYIPDSLTKIDRCVFYGCTSLSSVTIPNSVVTIGDHAFNSCSGLMHIVVPDSVNSIGYDAFANCKALRSVGVSQRVLDVTIPSIFPSSYWTITNIFISADVANISIDAFKSCSSVVSFEVSDANSSFKSCRGLLLTKDGEALVHGVNGDVILPATVTNIWSSAFYGCEELSNVMIPYGVVSIGDHAFQGCRELTSITIPNSVTTIGYEAFCSCSSLTNIQIGCEVESIGGFAFATGSKLSMVTIPQHVCVSRLADVFSDSYQTICDVEITGDVTNINPELFSGCTSIKKITAPIGLNEDIVGALGGKIDSIEFVWTNAPTGGDANWKLSQVNTHSGSVSLRSGAITHNQQSWMELNVKTPGRLSFWWKSSSESEGDDIYDYAYLSIDGSILGSRTINVDKYRLKGLAIGGKTEWTNVVISVSGDGQHTIRWTYCKDDVDEANVGDDCAWVDDIEWTPLVCASFDINGADGIAPTNVIELSGTTITLPSSAGFNREGYVFSGWNDGVNTYASGETYELADADVKLTAKWIKKSTLTFSLGEGVGIVPQAIAMVPGTKVQLPMATYFSRTNYTFIGWSDDSNTYGAGDTYEISACDVAFAAVWSANTITAPVISSLDVENGGAIESEYATVSITTEQGATIHYTMDGSSPSKLSPIYTAPFVADGMSVIIKAISLRENYFDSDVSTFTFTRKPYSLAECLGIEGYDVLTDEGSGWSRVLGSEAHDGVAALKSNVIGDSQTNWVQLTVCGSGTISFWWKVSCEGKNRGRRRDGCAFLIDGVEIEYSDGTTNDWSEITIEVSGQGTHKLKWVYGKNDNGTSDGEDCAWLDSVVWAPVQIDPLPEILSDGEVSAALAESADSNLVANVTNASQYASYRNWVLALTNDLVTIEQVKSSNKAWLSYALGADALVDKELSSENIQISSFSPKTDSNDKFEFIVEIEGINVGAGSVAAETLKENLKKVLGLEGGTSLEPGGLSSANVNITFGTPENGKIKFTAGPKNANEGSFFMRVKMTP